CDHALFHQTVGFILDGGFNHADSPVFVQPQAEFRSIAAEQGVLSAPFAQGGTGLMQLIQTVADLVGQGFYIVVLPAFDQMGYQLVAQFALGTDHRLVKAVAAQTAVVVHLQITDQHQTGEVWHQRAKPGTDAVGQHGQWFTGEINGGGPIEGFFLSGAPGFDDGCRVGNGDGQGPASGVRGRHQGIVHILGARTVNSHIRLGSPVFTAFIDGGNAVFTEAVRLLLDFFRPGVREVKIRQCDGPLDTGLTRLANNTQYFGLAFAVLDR